MPDIENSRKTAEKGAALSGSWAKRPKNSQKDRFQNFIVMAFPKKTSVSGAILISTPMPNPPQKCKFIFIVVTMCRFRIVPEYCWPCRLVSGMAQKIGAHQKGDSKWEKLVSAKSAVFCGSCEICGFLRFSAQICDSQIPYRASRKSAKICENVRSGSGFSLLLSPFWRAHRFFPIDLHPHRTRRRSRSVPEYCWLSRLVSRIPSFHHYTFILKTIKSCNCNCQNS